MSRDPDYDRLLGLIPVREYKAIELGNVYRLKRGLLKWRVVKLDKQLQQVTLRRGEETRVMSWEELQSDYWPCPRLSVRASAGVRYARTLRRRSGGE